MKPTFYPIVIPEYTGSKGPRFKDKHSYYVGNLKILARNWQKYLEHYLKTTGALFNRDAELPWLANERVLVSSLAASIMFCNKGAIVVEELPVTRLSGSTDRGRCDLWVHIPKNLSFYMEAKKFRKPRQVQNIENLLRGPFGISRMLADYAKGRGGKLNQRSVYGKDKERKHVHCIIGLICMPLTGIDSSNIDEVKTNFISAYTRSYGLPSSPNKRFIQRYPTVGFVFAAGNSKKEAMLVGMTVLGAH